MEGEEAAAVLGRVGLLGPRFAAVGRAVEGGVNLGVAGAVVARGARPEDDGRPLFRRVVARGVEGDLAVLVLVVANLRGQDLGPRRRAVGREVQAVDRRRHRVGAGREDAVGVAGVDEEAAGAARGVADVAGPPVVAAVARAVEAADVGAEHHEIRVGARDGDGAEHLPPLAAGVASGQKVGRHHRHRLPPPAGRGGAKGRGEREQQCGGKACGGHGSSGGSEVYRPPRTLARARPRQVSSRPPERCR